MSIWHPRSRTAPSDMFKDYCEQWLLPLWPALTVVSSPICPKWMAEVPTALMGYPFAWPAEPGTGSCGSWGEKDQKVLFFFPFRIPFRLRQTLAMILGFAKGVMVVYGTYWRCIDFVLWIHCLAMPAFQEVEGQPFIQDFILKSDRRGEGLMFHHGGVVTYSSSNVLETLSLYISYI